MDKYEKGYKLNEMFYAISYDEDLEGVLVYINTPDVWEEDGCLTDLYSDKTYENLEPELNKLNLYEEFSSTYSFNEEGITIEEAKKRLEKSNFSFRQDFQDWIDSFEY